MSLFEMPRYLGDDEEANEKQQLGSSEKLKKHLTAIKAKKQKLTLDSNTDSIQEPERLESQIKCNGGSITHSEVVPVDSATISEGNAEQTIDESSHKKKKKKKRKLSVGSDNEVHHTEMPKESESSLVEASVKTKKSKKTSDKGMQEAIVDAHDEDISKSVEHSKEKKKKKKRKLSVGSDNDGQSDHKVTESDSEKHVKQLKKNKYSKKENDGKTEQTLTSADVTLNTTKEAERVDKDENDSELMDIEETNDDAQDEDKPESGDRRRGGHREVGGFTVIGSVRKTKIEKVKRVLPEWLAKPSIISADLTKDKLPVSDMPGLDQDLVQLLQDNDIKHFFPVQRLVIPSLLESSLTGFQTGRAGYRPSDICVSAPTGSGKTLAFVLPIVQALRSRLTCEVRSLAVLPVTDLATQVFKVFQTYCKNTCLKIGLLIGQKPFAVEQRSLVKKTLSGYRSHYDILVATPGRLVEHINKTEGFHLEQLRYLVIDEADRMMEEIKQDWLLQVENAVYKSRPRPGPLTASNCLRMDMPLQKLLYSATLSQNPEKLQQLNLFQPRLYTSVVNPSSLVTSQANKATPQKVSDGKAHDAESVEGTGSTSLDVTGEEEIDEGANKQDETSTSEEKATFVGKYATPASLQEYYIETSMQKKPLAILHLLHHLKFRNILCFTNSVEATHRLFLLIKLVGGVTVKEFSSGLHVARRKGIVQKFMAGKIDILVCSDAMARGMDISTVKYVVSYDPPKHIQTYIHRIGRTARAGQEGTAFTLLQAKEFFHFKKMVRESGKEAVKSMKVFDGDLKPLIPKFEEALKKLEEILQTEKFKKTPYKRPHRKEFGPKNTPDDKHKNDAKSGSPNKDSSKDAPESMIIGS